MATEGAPVWSERRATLIASDLDLLLRQQPAIEHLVLHRSVRPGLIGAAHVPPGTIDARDRDAVGLVVDDPRRALVVLEGIWLPRASSDEPRWSELARHGRVVATIVISGLSGRYYHLSCADPHAAGGLDRDEELVTGVERHLVLANGAAARIDRTTRGVQLVSPGRRIGFDDVAAALASLPAPPGAATSSPRAATAAAGRPSRASITADAGQRLAAWWRAVRRR